MRVFIDACVDPRVSSAFPDHDVRTAVQIGYQREKDHQLILRLQDQFDVLVTIDRGFEYQHNLRRLRFGIVVVHVAKNKVEYYQPLYPQLKEAVSRVRPGEVVHVPAESGDAR